MEFKLQANFKDAEGGLYNVRGDTGAELVQNLQGFMAALPAINAAQAALSGSQPSQEAQALATVQAVFPDSQVVLPEWAVPQAAAPPPAQVPPTAVATAPQGDCPACGKTPVCKECNGPTAHIYKQNADKTKGWNCHQCTTNGKHSMNWCKTPIPTQLAPLLNNPNLKYG